MKKFYVFFVAVIFLSCSTEPIDEIVLNDKTSKNVMVENLDIYSNDYVENNYRLLEALTKNKKSNLNSDFLTSLGKTKNENDLKLLFESAGIENSIEIINLLKKNVQIQSAFRKFNPDFYKLDINKRTELLEKRFEIVLDKYDSSYNGSYLTHNYIKNDFGNYVPFEVDPDKPSDPIGEDCFDIYLKEKKRCERNFFICGGFAIASGLLTIGWGTVIAAGYCGVTANVCGDDANVDYKHCLKPYEELPWLPAEEVELIPLRD